MDDIIATGSTAAAASPGFATQDEVVDLSGDMEAELGYVYGEDAHEAQEPEEEGEEGGGEVDPALWRDLPPGSSQGWLRGNAGLPTPPSIEEHKWLIEPVGTE